MIFQIRKSGPSLQKQLDAERSNDAGFEQPAPPALQPECGAPDSPLFGNSKDQPQQYRFDPPVEWTHG